MSVSTSPKTRTVPEPVSPCQARVVPFGWGDWRGMLRLVEMTARREGFGDRLADGAWRLAESIHPEATRLVYAVKRLELPAHSARALKGLSIGYATATRGGSHNDTRPTRW